MQSPVASCRAVSFLQSWLGGLPAAEPVVEDVGHHQQTAGDVQDRASLPAHREQLAQRADGKRRAADCE